MSWHYQLRHRVMPNGEHYYDVVEAFTDPTGWTEDGMGASGETPAEVATDLHRMLKDIASHGILEDTSGPQPDYLAANQELTAFKGIFGDYEEPQRTLEQARMMWDSLKQQLATAQARIVELEEALKEMYARTPLGMHEFIHEADLAHEQEKLL